MTANSTPVSPTPLNDVSGLNAKCAKGSHNKSPKAANSDKSAILDLRPTLSLTTALFLTEQVPQ